MVTKRTPPMSEAAVLLRPPQEAGSFRLPADSSPRGAGAVHGARAGGKRGQALPRAQGPGISGRCLGLLAQAGDLWGRFKKKPQGESTSLGVLFGLTLLRYCQPPLPFVLFSSWRRFPFEIWVWVKIKPPGNRRFWSMFPLTRATHFGYLFLSHTHIPLGWFGAWGFGELGRCPIHLQEPGARIPNPSHSKAAKVSRARICGLVWTNSQVCRHVAL